MVVTGSFGTAEMPFTVADAPTGNTGDTGTDKKTTVLATTGSTAPVFLAGALLLAAVGAGITVTRRKRGQ